MRLSLKGRRKLIDWLTCCQEWMERAGEAQPPFPQFEQNDFCDAVVLKAHEAASIYMDFEKALLFFDEQKNTNRTYFEPSFLLLQEHIDSIERGIE